MKKIISVALLLAAFASAHAETFNFSYSFSDGQAVTGSLSGHLVGDLLEGVSDIHVNFNGTGYSGVLVGASWDAVTHDWNSAAGAVISTNAARNNFIFADADPQHAADSVNNYFYFVNSSDAAIGNQAFAVNYNSGDVAFDQPTSNASWSLVAAPVPEPSSIAMLAAGLGVMGAVARRRKQA
jgi:hypothetical protein